MTFQSVVVKVAIVIFIILMVVMALMLIKGRENKKWPPETPTCPDYWKYNKANNKCEDKFNFSSNSTEWPESGWLESDNITPKSDYKNYNSLNNKCCWAKYKAKVEWDGITNNNKLCKDCPGIYTTINNNNNNNTD